MTMKRKAILIASPLAQFGNPPPKPIWGVRNDIIVWENFLTSSMGGCWDSRSEIINASEYTGARLKREISLLDRMDYIFFVYSGHGFSDDQNDYILLGNGKDSISLAEIKSWLAPKTDCGTIVVDACRELIPSSSQSGVLLRIEKNSNSLDESVSKSFKSSWETEFRHCSTKGIVTIQSCERGKKSFMLGDNQFSVFSWFLNRGFRSRKHWLTVGDAFDIAKRYTQKTTQSWEPPEDQKPFCDNPEADYPFCMNSTEAIAAQINSDCQ